MGEQLVGRESGHKTSHGGRGTGCFPSLMTTPIMLIGRPKQGFIHLKKAYGGLQRCLYFKNNPNYIPAEKSGVGWQRDFRVASTTKTLQGCSVRTPTRCFGCVGRSQAAEMLGHAIMNKWRPLLPGRNQTFKSWRSLSRWLRSRKAKVSE
jgi:hypothetical protein